jgi:hypothetical protein
MQHEITAFIWLACLARPSAAIALLLPEKPVPGRSTFATTLACARFVVVNRPADLVALLRISAWGYRSLYFLSTD